MRWHPDRNRDNLKEAERRFKELGAAYAVLSDVAKRRDYDVELERVARGGNARGAQFEEEVDAKTAAEIFLRAMMEMSTAMAMAGHNRDVIFGALLSQGCPGDLAKRIADDTVKAMAQAKAEETRRVKEEVRAKARQEANRRQEAAAQRERDKASHRPVTTHTEGLGTVFWVSVCGFALLLIVALINLPRNSNHQTTSANFAEPSSAQASQINSNPPSEPVKNFNLAVAARSANIRKGASAKMGIAAVANRGDGLVETGRENGFINVELENGRKGWISDQLVIDRSRSYALSATTASQYGVASSKSLALEKYLREVSEKDDVVRVRTIFTAAAGDPVRLNRELQDLVLSLQFPTFYGADVDAKRWWALEAKWQSDNGTNPSDELAAAVAAAQADPADVDVLMGLGMASIKAETGDILFSRLAYTLPLLAPGSTNTWVIVAAWAAQRGEQKLAATALSLAMSKSKSPSVTKAYVVNVAATASDPLVVAAFRLGANPSDTSSINATSIGPASLGTAGGTPALSAVSNSDLSCSGTARYAPKYEQSMAALVQAAGGYAVPPGFSSLQVELVNALCRGDRNNAIAMVNDSRLDGRFAEKARQILAPNMSPLIDASARPL